MIWGIPRMQWSWECHSPLWPLLLRKRVRPGGSVGSSPRSSSSSNLTFFSFDVSMAGVGASCHLTLLLVSQCLGCSLSSFIEQVSHTLAGQDHGGLGRVTDAELGHLGEGFWCCLDLSLPWEHHLSGTWPSCKGVTWLILPPPDLCKGIKAVKWNGLRSNSGTYQRGSSWLSITSASQPWVICNAKFLSVQLPHAFVLLSMQRSMLRCQHTVLHCRFALPPTGSLNKGDPRRVCTWRRCSGAIASAGSTGQGLGAPLSMLFLPHCSGTLWSMCSNKDRAKFLFLGGTSSPWMLPS